LAHTGIMKDVWPRYSASYSLLLQTCKTNV